jgi:polar amino acid transport system permease protein
MSVFWHFLFYGPIVEGAKLTFLLAVASQLLGIAIGVFLALGRLSRLPLPILRWPTGVYIWFFRGTPLLVQLIFVYDGIPQIDSNIVLGSITSAFIALSLNEGAYMAEIVRAGILSVNPGQFDDASHRHSSGN